MKSNFLNLLLEEKEMDKTRCGLALCIVGRYVKNNIPSVVSQLRPPIKSLLVMCGIEESAMHHRIVVVEQGGVMEPSE